MSPLEVSSLAETWSLPVLSVSKCRNVDAELVEAPAFSYPQGANRHLFADPSTSSGSGSGLTLRFLSPSKEFQPASVILIQVNPTKKQIGGIEQNRRNGRWFFFQENRKTEITDSGRNLDNTIQEFGREVRFIFPR